MCIAARRTCTRCILDDSSKPYDNILLAIAEQVAYRRSGINQPIACIRHAALDLLAPKQCPVLPVCEHYPISGSGDNFLAVMGGWVKVGNCRRSAQKAPAIDGQARRRIAPKLKRMP